MVKCFVSKYNNCDGLGLYWRYLIYSFYKELICRCFRYLIIYLLYQTAVILIQCIQYTDLPTNVIHQCLPNNGSPHCFEQYGKYMIWKMGIIFMVYVKSYNLEISKRYINSNNVANSITLLFGDIHILTNVLIIIYYSHILWIYYKWIIHNLFSLYMLEKICMYNRVYYVINGNVFFVFA